jgi:hypothetical protein
MKIIVTQDDIRQGLPHNGYFCPVACAIKRQLKSPSAYVGVKISFLKDGVVIDVPLPDMVRDFIRAFDNDGFVEPFEFEI